MKFFAVVFTLILVHEPGAWAGHLDLKTEMKKITGVLPLADGRRISDRHSKKGMAVFRSYLKSLLPPTLLINSEKFKIEKDHLRLLPERDPVGENFYVNLPATEESERWIVLGAHYDSSSSDNPAANDNGTGVLAAVELLRRAKELNHRRHNLRVVFFDAEEQPMMAQGSSIHFDRAILAKKRDELFINLDMLGYSHDTVQRIAFEVDEFSAIADFLHDRSPQTWELVERGVYQSDNLSSIQRGIPTVSFFEAPLFQGKEIPYYPYAHTENDSSVFINWDYYESNIDYLEFMLFQFLTVDPHWETPLSRARKEWSKRRAAAQLSARGYKLYCADELKK